MLWLAQKLGCRSDPWSSTISMSVPVPFVVGRQERNQLALHLVKTAVERGEQPAVLLVHVVDAVEVGLDDFGRVVSRAVVDDDDVECLGGVGLPQDAVDRPGQKVAVVVG